MKNFIKKRSRKNSKSKPSKPPNVRFSQRFDKKRTYFSSDVTFLPYFLNSFYKYILLSGVVKGILRKPGSHKQTEAIIENINEHKLIQLDSYDVYSIADVIKLYFGRLPDPIFKSDNYELFVDISKKMVDDYCEENRKQLKEAILSVLPRNSYMIIRNLFKFLWVLEKQYEVTKMTSKNIALIFTGSLIKPLDITMEYVKEIKFLSVMVEDLMANFVYYFDYDEDFDFVINEELADNIKFPGRDTPSTPTTPLMKKILSLDPDLIINPENGTELFPDNSEKNGEDENVKIEEFPKVTDVVEEKKKIVTPAANVPKKKKRRTGRSRRANSVIVRKRSRHKAARTKRRKDIESSKEDGSYSPRSKSSVDYIDSPRYYKKSAPVKKKHGRAMTMAVDHLKPPMLKKKSRKKIKKVHKKVKAYQKKIKTLDKTISSPSLAKLAKRHSIIASEFVLDDAIGKKWDDMLESTDTTNEWIIASYLNKNTIILNPRKGNTYEELYNVLKIEKDIAYVGLKVVGIHKTTLGAQRSSYYHFVFIPKMLGHIKKSKLFYHRNDIRRAFHHYHYFAEINSATELRYQIKRRFINTFSYESFMEEIDES